MRTQEHAFRVYYASMTDAELLQIASNRKSFIGIAQTVLASELEKRGITPVATPPPPAHHSLLWNWLHHHPASTMTAAPDRRREGDSDEQRFSMH